MAQTPTDLPETHQRALHDAQHLSRVLERVQRDARKLMWHDERPWKTNTHVWAEGPMPVIDLHDLNVKLARRCVDKARKMQLKSGAVCFVTGVGNNSIGPPKLKQTVHGMLASACEKNEDWSFRSDGPGRYVLITDPERAPAAVQTSLPSGFWFLIAAIAAAIAFAFLRDVTRALF